MKLIRITAEKNNIRHESKQYEKAMVQALRDVGIPKEVIEQTVADYRSKEEAFISTLAEVYHG